MKCETDRARLHRQIRQGEYRVAQQRELLEGLPEGETRRLVAEVLSEFEDDLRWLYIQASQLDLH